MTTHFYTVTIDGVNYALETGIYGRAKVAKRLNLQISQVQLGCDICKDQLLPKESIDKQIKRGEVNK